MKKIFTLCFALLAGLYFVAGVHQVEAAEVKLKMVTMLPAKHPVGKSFGGFIKRINAALKGEFQIDWRGGPDGPRRHRAEALPPESDLAPPDTDAKREAVEILSPSGSMKPTGAFPEVLQRVERSTVTSSKRMTAEWNQEVCIEC